MNSRFLGALAGSYGGCGFGIDHSWLQKMERPGTSRAEDGLALFEERTARLGAIGRRCKFRGVALLQSEALTRLQRRDSRERRPGAWHRRWAFFRDKTGESNGRRHKFGLWQN